MGIIILASQSILEVFFCKILYANSEKHDIDIYIDGKDMKVSIWVLVVVLICSTSWLIVNCTSTNNLQCNVNHNTTSPSNKMHCTIKSLIYDAPKPNTWQILVLSCDCLCRIPWRQMLSREWRCSWSSADRRCSNYIWVIDNFIAY